MPEEVPPGRAGRLWLRGRLDVARRGAELLDRKRELLAAELRAGADRRVAVQAACREAERTAEAWGRRAEVLGGALEVAIVAKRLEGRADVELAVRDAMGVDHPTEAAVTPPEFPPLAAAASNAALGPAVDAYCVLVAAAATRAVHEASARALERELAATSRRVRALEHHRIPFLERSLDGLEVRLEEFEREERVVARWAQRRALRPDERSRQSPRTR